MLSLTRATSAGATGREQTRPHADLFYTKVNSAAEGVDRVLLWWTVGQAIAGLGKCPVGAQTQLGLLSDSKEVGELECVDQGSHPSPESSRPGQEVQNSGSESNSFDVVDLYPVTATEQSWPEPFEEYWGCTPSPRKPTNPYPEVLVDIFLTQDDTVCVILMVTESPWVSSMAMGGLVQLEKVREQRVGRKREICAWRCPSFHASDSAEKDSGPYFDAVEVDLWECSESEGSIDEPCTTGFDLVRASLSMTTLMGERKDSATRKVSHSSTPSHTSSKDVKLGMRFRRLRDLDSAKESVYFEKNAFDFDPIWIEKPGSCSDFFRRLQRHTIQLSYRSRRNRCGFRGILKRYRKWESTSISAEINRIRARVKKRLLCCGRGDWSDCEE